MERKRYNGRQVAHRLDWSSSRVSRLINGKRGVRDVDLAAFMAVCDITGDRRNHVLDLHARTGEQSWLQEHGGRLPARLFTLDFLEVSARAMTQIDLCLVPVLLQTESYLRAALHSLPVIPESEVDARVVEGLRRQEILSGGGVFEFFIHEHALTRTGPGRQVMSDQLHHLLRMSVRPTVTIRVIPETPESLAASMPFRIMEFTDHNPVVYLEFLNSVAFLERQDTVAAYRQLVTALDKVALDQDASRDWLTTAAADVAAGD